MDAGAVHKEVQAQGPSIVGFEPVAGYGRTSVHAHGRLAASPRRLPRSDGRAVGFVVGIEGNARSRATQQPRQNLFSGRKRRFAHILAVKFEEFNEGPSRFRQGRAAQLSLD
jgi:hypothetical protein